MSLHQPPTHAVVVRLPVSNGLGPAPVPWPADLSRHTIRLTPVGEILWDGEAIVERELVANLEAAALAPERPAVLLAPDASVSYDLSVKVINIIVASGISVDQYCLAGLSQHRDFGKQGSEIRLNLTLDMPEKRIDWWAPTPEIIDCGESSVN